mgnify:CR=1 FL=1
MQSPTLSRRSFVAGAASAAVAAVACAPVAARASEPAWTHEADVVIVGLGGAGSAAAVEALENGSSVCVLELAGRGGGATMLSGGLLYMGGTALQERLGVEDSTENMLAYLTKACGPSADPQMLKLFAETSPELFDWLEAHGVTFEGDVLAEGHQVVAPEGIVLNYSGNERAKEYAEVAHPVPRGHSPNGGGMAVIEALDAIVDEQAQVLYETRGTELVQDADGRVVGVLGEGSDGTPVAVHALKGVVLSCGAFTFNDELLANNHPYALIMGVRTGIPADTGDGIIMGMRVGAATKSLGTLSLQKHFYRFGTMPFGIAVDYRGLRYMNEEGYGSWTGRDIIKVSPDKGYIIGDSTIVDDLADAFGFDDTTPVAHADTIEELAELMDAPFLVKQIELYNQMVDEGEDTQCGRFAENLVGFRPEDGPFHAGRIQGGYLGGYTSGGLDIDVHGQVLDNDQQPIPGLFAAGRSARSIAEGVHHPSTGMSCAQGMLMGRVIGRYLSGKE